MTATTETPTPAASPNSRALADLMIQYLETGVAAEGLFAPDMFCDLTLPTWRLQAADAAGAQQLRSGGHPWPGRVSSFRYDPIPTGFVLEVEEEWRLIGEDWYCREFIRADVGPDGIAELSIYCTGDWNAARKAEHAAEVTLIRP